MIEIQSIQSNVNHPQHYNQAGRKECIVELEENYGPVVTCIFCLTNAYKYLYRAGYKVGSPEMEDIEKAKFYFNYMQERPTLARCTLSRKATKLYADIAKEIKRYA